MRLDKAKLIANATSFEGDTRVGMLQALKAARVLARTLENLETGLDKAILDAKIETVEVNDDGDDVYHEHFDPEILEYRIRSLLHDSREPSQF
jgi:hypothetical protein